MKGRCTVVCGIAALVVVLGAAGTDAAGPATLARGGAALTGLVATGTLRSTVNGSVAGTITLTCSGPNRGTFAIAFDLPWYLSGRTVYTLEVQPATHPSLADMFGNAGSSGGYVTHLSSTFTPCVPDPQVIMIVNVNTRHVYFQARMSPYRAVYHR